MGTAVEVTTNIGCLVQCKFCPQDVSMSNYATKNELDTIKFGNPILMSYENFKTLLKKIPNNVTIRFSGFSEPFLNPQCAKMIEYAYASGYVVELFSTLVGMTLEDIDILKKIKLKKFVIHLADVEKFAKIGVTENYKDLLKKIVSLSIENTFFMLMGTIPNDVKEIVGIDVKASEMVDIAGHSEFGSKTDRVVGPILCSQDQTMTNTLRDNILIPNGDVLLCCKDWAQEYVIGNLFDCEYEELFQSSKYNEIIKKMQSENENILCRNCEFAASSNKIKQLQEQYTKLSIDPTDSISTKLNEIYQNYLERPIDPEGLIYFHTHIKSGKITYHDVEMQLKDSSEYKTLPRRLVNN